MKPLNKDEVLLIQKHLEASYLDSRLQKCLAVSQGLLLEMYKNKELFYLYISMNPQSPLLLDFDKNPFKIEKKVTPVLLFLRTHFEGKRLSEILYEEKKERVLVLKFGYDEPYTLELRLFPHGQNILVKALAKKISLHPVKELKEAMSTLKFQARTLEELRLEALPGTKNLSSSVGTGKSVDVEEVRAKIKAKKEKALAACLGQLEEIQTQKWQELGEFLVSHQTLKVPEKFKELVDTQKSLAVNIQNSFDKAKNLKLKLDGLNGRIAALKQELLDLETADISSLTQEKKNKEESRKKDKWKGYRYPVNDKSEVFVGKNATENLNILRHAKSWDIWLHLKDYPGAHGLIKRPRNLELTDEDLQVAARYVAQHSKKSAHFLTSGDSFEILIAECRFVRPIKGDKLGRVQYSDERVLTVRL